MRVVRLLRFGGAGVSHVPHVHEAGGRFRSPGCGLGTLPQEGRMPRPFGTPFFLA